MPPRRPLPDLCVIAVMKMLTPNDQLKTAQMSPRCEILVRDANRRVKMLVIARSDDFDGEEIKSDINSFSLASEPIMRLLPAGGEPFLDYPMTTTRISKWNCLLVDKDQLLDQPTVEQIVKAFSAVTELKFKVYDNVSCKNLIALLQHPKWTNQLTNLAVLRRCILNNVTDLPTKHLLITAINALSALQCLAVELDGGRELPDLTILAQLKVIAFRIIGDVSGFVTFLDSLELHAAGNVDLQVHLFDSAPGNRVLHLSEPVSARIARYGDPDISNPFEIPPICRRFPSLTTLYVECLDGPGLRALFTALSTLPQLVHLELFLDWEGEVENQFAEEQPPPRPLAQLTSLRALVLSLQLRSHSQIQWLNLPVTMPRLQAIHVQYFSCVSCGADLYKYLRGEYSKYSNPNTSTTLKCLRATLSLLHPGVPYDRIILGRDPPYHILKYLLYINQ